MALELLLSTPHTHGLITLCTMDDPNRCGLVAINQGFKGTCDVDRAVAPDIDQLYVGFKVTGMHHYNLPTDKLRENMALMVRYHALCVLRVGKDQLLIDREIAMVYWNDNPPAGRNDLGLDKPKYSSKLLPDAWDNPWFAMDGRGRLDFYTQMDPDKQARCHRTLYYAEDGKLYTRLGYYEQGHEALRSAQRWLNPRITDVYTATELGTLICARRLRE